MRVAYFVNGTSISCTTGIKILTTSISARTLFACELFGFETLILSKQFYEFS